MFIQKKSQLSLISIILVLFFISDICASQSVEVYTSNNGVDFDDSIPYCYVDSSGSVWAYCNKRLSRYSNGVWDAISTFNNKRVFFIQSVSASEVWVGSSLGLHTFKDDLPPVALPDDTGRTVDPKLISMTSPSNIWIGDGDDVARFNGNVWKTYTKHYPTNNHDDFTTIQAVGDSSCFLIEQNGTYTNYADYFDGTAWGYLDLPHPYFGHVVSDGNGGIWIDQYYSYHNKNSPSPHLSHFSSDTVVSYYLTTGIGNAWSTSEGLWLLSDSLYQILEDLSLKSWPGDGVIQWGVDTVAVYATDYDVVTKMVSHQIKFIEESRVFDSITTTFTVPNGEYLKTIVDTTKRNVWTIFESVVVRTNILSGESHYFACDYDLPSGELSKNTGLIDKEGALWVVSDNYTENWVAKIDPTTGGVAPDPASVLQAFSDTLLTSGQTYIFPLNALFYNEAGLRIGINLLVSENDATIRVLTPGIPDLTDFRTYRVEIKTSNYLPGDSLPIGIEYTISSRIDTAWYMINIEKPIATLPEQTIQSNAIRILEKSITFPKTGAYKVSLYSANGRLVKEVTDVSNSLSLENLGLANGVYQIRAVQGVAVYTEQLILK
jgi:hypothetical protein